MNLPPLPNFFDAPSPEMAELVERLCHDELLPQEGERLEWLIANDRGARTFYVRYIHMHAELSTCGNGRTQMGETTPRRPVLRFLGSQVTLVGRSTVLAILLVAFAFYGGFALLAWNMRPNIVSRATESSGPSARTFVATITAEDNCVWKADPRPEVPHIGRRLLAEEAILLHSGVVQLTFAHGASVAVEGPCEVVLRTAGKGYLRNGKLAAHVPLQAVGFEVETPNARVVDLGTDFRLEVSPEETRLAVIAGKVDLFAANVSAHGKRTAGSSRRVKAGQAVTVAATAGGTAVVRETKFDAEWLSATADTLPQNRSVSSVVAYQISESAAGNQRGFHGGVGLDFEVRVPIRVFSLGVFDHLGDGIDPATSPTVQLWSRYLNGSPSETSDDKGLEMLASAVFTADDGGEFKQGHRFKPLPRPIELPIGSYTIVAYGLSNANPFIALENTAKEVEFDRDPKWSGSNNVTDGNHYGWCPDTHEAGGNPGEVGGAFARSQRRSFYGDTQLSKTFTLDDKIVAAGKFDVVNISLNWADTLGTSGFFIGHFSTATDNEEFIGLEFQNLSEAMGMHFLKVRARYQRSMKNSLGTNSNWTIVSTDSNHAFSYSYVPNADGSGRLTVKIDGQPALVADLTDGERHSGGKLDAFGMGVVSDLNSENDPNKTAQLFIDDLTYSGFRALAPSKISPVDLTRSELRAKVDTLHGAIMPVGSRLGKAEPGTFPYMSEGRPSMCAAGSFEYGQEQRAVGRGQ